MAGHGEEWWHSHFDPHLPAAAAALLSYISLVHGMVILAVSAAVIILNGPKVVWPFELKLDI
jgi:hypothetical protein